MRTTRKGPIKPARRYRERERKASMRPVKIGGWDYEKPHKRNTRALAETSRAMRSVIVAALRRRSIRTCAEDRSRRQTRNCERFMKHATWTMLFAPATIEGRPTRRLWSNNINREELIDKLAE